MFPLLLLLNKKKNDLKVKNAAFEAELKVRKEFAEKAENERKEEQLIQRVSRASINALRNDPALLRTARNQTTAYKPFAAEASAKA